MTDGNILRRLCSKKSFPATIQLSQLFIAHNLQLNEPKKTCNLRNLYSDPSCSQPHTGSGCLHGCILLWTIVGKVLKNGFKIQIWIINNCYQHTQNCPVFIYSLPVCTPMYCYCWGPQKRIAIFVMHVGTPWIALDPPSSTIQMKVGTRCQSWHCHSKKALERKLYIS